MTAFQEVAKLPGHGLSAAETVPQDCLLDHHGELVARRLHDAVTAHPCPHGVFDIIGRRVETRVGQQQRVCVRRGLEETRDNRRAVDLEQARALIQRPPGILGVAQARTRQPPPLDIHRVGRPGRRDKVGGLTLGAAYPAPDQDVGVAECLLGRLDATGLRLMPAWPPRTAPGRSGPRPAGSRAAAPRAAAVPAGRLTTVRLPLPWLRAVRSAGTGRAERRVPMQPRTPVRTTSRWKGRPPSRLRRSLQFRRSSGSAPAVRRTPSNH